MTVAECFVQSKTTTALLSNGYAMSRRSRDWSGLPLTDYETIVALIAGTRTQTGLRVHCTLNPKPYPTKIRISNQQMAQLDLLKHPDLPEWNYTLLPRTTRN